MTKTFDNFIHESQTATKLLSDFAKRNGLVGNVTADHICYKCDSAQTYDAMRNMLEEHCKFSYQSEVAGRRVAFIKLKVPVQSELNDIWFVELSDKKPEKPQIRGFHHVEIYPQTESYDELVKKLELRGEKMELDVRPHHTTHDIPLTETFLIRLTHGPLLKKIKVDEFR